jgi:hypothetical protein
MSILEQVRNKNNNQQFAPNREGLAGQYDDSMAYREAYSIRPTSNYPTRVLSPNEARALEQQQLQEQAIRNQLQEQEMRRMERDFQELGNSGRPTLIRR